MNSNKCRLGTTPTRSAPRNTHSTVGWLNVVERSVVDKTLTQSSTFLFSNRGGRDGVPRVLPDGHPHPHAPRQEDAQALPPPPQRHLPLRGVLWGECSPHGGCGRGVELL